jgi:hypothetical protein
MKRLTLLLCVAIAGVVGVTLATTTGSAQTTRAKETAQITKVNGTVTVNGNSVGKGATILSDAAVTTAAKSSAVVSLGKLGRVEVLPDTTDLKLSYGDSSISLAMLNAGRVRVSSSSGVSASATTNDGVIAADSAQKNEFTVDTSCGNTFVAVKKGAVTLRAGNSVKQIAAGSQDTAGQARPGCEPGK